MAANPIDLTTVSIVETYLPVVSAPATDAAIQLLITSASRYWLWRTGLASLNSIGTYDEFFDGSGGTRQFVHNQPIVSVTGVFVNGQSIPQSTAANIAGWVIDQNKTNIAMRSGGYGISNPAIVARIGFGWNGYAFFRGVQNVEIQYTAGYSVTPFDVQDKVTKQVATEFRRRGWLDQKSQMLDQAGTISYTQFTVAPDIEQVIQNYKRVAIV